VLQPSFKPVEVTFVEPYHWLNEHRADKTKSGRAYRLEHIHPTKEAAIAHGRLELKRIRIDLDKREENLKKKTAALDKAEGKLTT
jgi:hypothetical protein